MLVREGLNLSLKRESENDPEKAYALLFGASGLLPAQPKMFFDNESKSVIRKMWDWWWRKSNIFADNTMKSDEWVLAGIRPQNHPQRRLLAAAKLFVGQKQSLLKKMSEIFNSSSNDYKRMIAEALKELAVNSSDYWRKHIILGSPVQNNTGKLIGKSRAVAILINIVIPFLVAEKLEHLLDTDFLSELPPEDSNTIVRRAARNLLGTDHNPHLIYNCALRQQGLIQIYYDFCMVDKTLCEDCLFSKALLS